MFKLFALVFAALLAVAAAGVVSYASPAVYSAGVLPSVYSAPAVAYSSPLAYSSGYVAPYVY